jgi:hypothetical protein
MEAQGEKRYSSYSFTTSALEECELSASCLGRALPAGKGLPVPIVQEAGWDPEPVWTQRLEEKSFASTDKHGNSATWERPSQPSAEHLGGFREYVRLSITEITRVQ